MLTDYTKVKVKVKVKLMSITLAQWFPKWGVDPLKGRVAIVIAAGQMNQFEGVVN